MKKLLASLFHRQDSIDLPERVEPVFASEAILFSTPTLSNDVAVLEPLAYQPDSNAFLFHEDEWSQVEFLPASQLDHVKHILEEYSRFERERRTDAGWREVYIRQLARVPVISGETPLAWLEAQLGVSAQAGPLLFAASRVQGRVKDGFSLALGGEVTLYGHENAEGIPLLGVHLGTDADQSVLSGAFATLNASIGLVLVDWRSQFVMVSRPSSGTAQMWKPGQA